MFLSRRSTPVTSMWRLTLGSRTSPVASPVFQIIVIGFHNQPGTNGSNTLSASQLPTNNSNGALSQTENSKTRPISVRNPGPCPTEPPESPERHTSQPPAISTSTTQAKARTVYLDALYMVCCPCFARRRRDRLLTESCSQGGLELGL